MTNEELVLKARDRYQKRYASASRSEIDPVDEADYVSRYTKVPLPVVVPILLFDANKCIGKDNENYKFYRKIYKEWMKLIYLLCQAKGIPFPHI